MTRACGRRLRQRRSDDALDSRSVGEPDAVICSVLFYLIQLRVTPEAAARRRASSLSPGLAAMRRRSQGGG